MDSDVEERKTKKSVVYQIDSEMEEERKTE